MQILVDIRDTFAYGIVFVFKKKTAYEMRISDWSSDVCSSDLFTLIDFFPAAQECKSQPRLPQTETIESHKRSGCWEHHRGSAAGQAPAPPQHGQIQDE